MHHDSLAININASIQEVLNDSFTLLWSHVKVLIFLSYKQLSRQNFCARLDYKGVPVENRAP